MNDHVNMLTNDNAHKDRSIVTMVSEWRKTRPTSAVQLGCPARRRSNSYQLSCLRAFLSVARRPGERGNLPHRVGAGTGRGAWRATLAGSLYALHSAHVSDITHYFAADAISHRNGQCAGSKEARKASVGLYTTFICMHNLYTGSTYKYGEDTCSYPVINKCPFSFRKYTPSAIC